jgi:hypothetical protein
MSDVTQSGSARGQRGAKAQPGPAVPGAGAVPGIGVRGVRASGRGTEPTRPRVYGMRGRVRTASTGPVSTMRPAYRTATRSAVRATTPRSWVTRSRAAPVSLRTSARASNTCAWTVTSSALVGSSAIRTSGLLAIAIAIIARWRIPPDNWWGYARAAHPGLGTPTKSSSSTARRCADSRRGRGCWWMRSASASWSPTRCTGVKACSGSWKTIAIRRPRIRANSLTGRPSSSSPRRRTEPPTRASAGASPIRASAVSVLPVPDSPTRPRTSPRRRVRSTPRTTGEAPSVTVRSRTSRTAFTGTSPTGRCGSAWSSPPSSDPARPAGRRRPG